MGYIEGGAPFPFSDANKQPQGYSVDLCREVASGIRAQLGLAKLDTRWVALSLQNRLEAVRSGRVDIDCSTTTWTLTRQKDVDFSLITFIDGATVLATGGNDILRFADYNHKRIAVIRGTTTVAVLQEALQSRSVTAEVVPVSNRAEGLQLLRGGKVDGFASDRIVLMGMVLTDSGTDRFRLLDDDFSAEQYAPRSAACRSRFQARGKLRARAPLSHRRHHAHLRSMARQLRPPEHIVVCDALSAIDRGVVSASHTMGSRATEKVTAPVATIALWTQSPDAQTIRLPDFREKPPIANRAPDGPCPECGVVRSIREIHKRRDDSLQRTATAGSASSFDTRRRRARGASVRSRSADKSASVGGVVRRK